MRNIQRINQRFYDVHCAWWTENKVNSFWHEAQFRKFLTYTRKGDRILDIGCANGIHVPLFLGMGRNLRYEGLDISKKMLGMARRRYPQLTFYASDILKSETLPQRRYNGFWAAAILMHIPKEDWPKMLMNIQKMMQPGCVGYMTLPRRRPRPRSAKDQRFFSYWTPQSMEAFLTKRNWKVLATGNMPKRDAGWFWAIVRLPKS